MLGSWSLMLPILALNRISCFSSLTLTISASDFKRLAVELNESVVTYELTNAFSVEYRRNAEFVLSMKPSITTLADSSEARGVFSTCADMALNKIDIEPVDLPVKVGDRLFELV